MAFSRSFLALVTACAWMGFSASPLQAFTVPGTPIITGRRSALNLRPSATVGKGLPVAPTASRRRLGPVMAGNQMVDLKGKVMIYLEIDAESHLIQSLFLKKNVT